MGHLFHYPTVSSPIATLDLRPTLVTVHDDALTRPLQRVHESPTGVPWPFELSSRRHREYRVRVDRLPTMNTDGFAGYEALRSFFSTWTEWMRKPFSLTHTDGGGAVQVRLLLDTWAFHEGHKDVWSGDFTLLRVP